MPTFVQAILQQLHYLIGTTFWLSSLIFILILINLALCLKEKRKNFERLKNGFGYPVPTISNPIFGHLDEFKNRDTELKWHQQLGKIFGFYYCDAPHLKICDINLITEIFIRQNRIFNARTWHEYRLRAIIKSILFNSGDRWKKTRKLIQPALAEYRIKSNETNIILDIQNGLDKLIKHFKHLLRCESDGDGIDLTDRGDYARKGFIAVEHPESSTGWALDMNAYAVMQVVTLDVVFRLAFNMDIVDVTKGAEEPSLQSVKFIMTVIERFVYKVAQAVPFSRVFLVPWMEYLDPTFSRYKGFLQSIIDYNARKSKIKCNNPSEGGTQPRRIYNILEDEYNAGNLSRNELMSNTMAIVMAGFETTATTSTYVLWCIAKHKSLAVKLRSDILNYGIESRYLDMFIKEVMRMYPALPNFVIRTPSEDIKLAGYNIKRGMSVYMSVNTVHYDPALWENPYHFDPERFSEGKTYPSGAYAPFGLGHRMCAGYQLALREMKTIVCELLTNFDIHLIAPQEMAVESSSIFLTKPKHEIRLRLIPAMSTKFDSANGNQSADEIV